MPKIPDVENLAQWFHDAWQEALDDLREAQKQLGAALRRNKKLEGEVAQVREDARSTEARLGERIGELRKLAGVDRRTDPTRNGTGPAAATVRVPRLLEIPHATPPHVIDALNAQLDPYRTPPGYSQSFREAVTAPNGGQDRKIPEQFVMKDNKGNLVWIKSPRGVENIVLLAHDAELTLNQADTLSTALKQHTAARRRELFDADWEARHG